jgi:hypothetical protein
VVRAGARGIERARGGRRRARVPGGGQELQADDPPGEGSGSGRLPVGVGPAAERIRSFLGSWCCPVEPGEPPGGVRTLVEGGPWHGAARLPALGGAQPQLTLVPAYEASSGTNGALAGAIIGGELGRSR